GEDTPRRSYGDLADRQKLMIELELLESPRVGSQRHASPLDEGFDVAIVLLEMLGPNEEALRPNDLVVRRHLLLRLRECSIRLDERDGDGEIVRLDLEDPILEVLGRHRDDRPPACVLEVAKPRH